MSNLEKVGEYWVEGDALRVAEKINEYDENLRVQFLERPEKIDDAPYRVIETCKDGVDRVVLHAWKLDDTVLERIYNADNQKHDLDAIITGKNIKARANEQSRYEERVAEAHDIAAHVLKSPKQSYTVKDGKNIIKFE